MKEEIKILGNELLSVLLACISIDLFLSNEEKLSLLMSLVFMLSIVLLAIPIITYRLSGYRNKDESLFDISVSLFIFLLNFYVQDKKPDLVYVNLILRIIPMVVVLESLFKVYISFSRFPETKSVNRAKKTIEVTTRISYILVLIKPNLYNYITAFNILLTIGAGYFIFRNETPKLTRDSRYEQKILVVSIALTILPILLSYTVFARFFGENVHYSLLSLLSLPMAISFILIKRAYPNLTIIKYLSVFIIVVIITFSVIAFSIGFVGLSIKQFLVILAAFIAMYFLVMLFVIMKRNFSKQNIPDSKGHVTLEEFLVDSKHYLSERLNLVDGLEDYSFILDQDGHRITVINNSDGQTLSQQFNSSLYAEFKGTLYHESNLNQDEVHIIEETIDQYTKLVSQFYTLSKLGSLEKNEVQSQGLRVIERESKEMADFIHDNVLQDMLALTRMVEALSTDQLELKEQILSVMRNSSKRLRDKMNELSPTNIKEIGLLQGLFELSVMLNANQDETRVIFKPKTELRVPEDEIFVIYRCTQELVQNALKHAKADRIIITADQSDFYLKISVIDNGIGFNSDKKLDSKESYGLFSIRRDLALVNGELNIESSVGEGTTADIVVPVKAYY